MSAHWLMGRALRSSSAHVICASSTNGRSPGSFNPKTDPTLSRIRLRTFRSSWRTVTSCGCLPRGMAPMASLAPFCGGGRAAGHVRGGASDLTRDTVVMYLRRCFQYQYGVSVTRGPWRQHASCLHDHAAWQRNIAILASCSTAAMAMLWHMAVRMASRYQAALRPPPPRPARARARALRTALGLASLSSQARLSVQCTRRLPKALQLYAFQA